MQVNLTHLPPELKQGLTVHRSEVIHKKTKYIEKETKIIEILCEQINRQKDGQKKRKKVRNRN